MPKADQNNTGNDEIYSLISLSVREKEQRSAPANLQNTLKKENVASIHMWLFNV